jgi:hypothetical protein
LQLDTVLDLTMVPRNPTELDCLNLFITPPLWQSLLSATNSYMASQLSVGAISRSKGYNLANLEELKKVFFARMDLLDRHVPSIEAGFLQVQC